MGTMDFNTRVGVISSWEPAFELALRCVGLTWKVNMKGEHFQWGLEANIGLKDLRIAYMNLDTPFNSTYLNYLAVTCGWHF